MPKKTKFGFGSSSSVEAAVEKGLLNARDLLLLDEDTDKPKFGWISKDGKPVILTDEKADLSEVEADVEALETEMSKKADAETVASELATKANAKEVNAKIDEVDAKFDKYMARMYEIVKAPDGTLVDYDEQEIRIMIPAATDFATQENASSTGAENIFYIEARVYAPEGATGFRTDVNEIAKDEAIEDFNGQYSGIDEFDRKYFILYQPVAYYDTESNAWVYYGVNSTTQHYVGWNQITEWYDANGAMIASDSIRINLSNEDCHFEIKPYYVGEMMKEVDTIIEKKIAEVESAYEIIEF